MPKSKKKNKKRNVQHKNYDDNSNKKTKNIVRIGALVLAVVIIVSLMAMYARMG